MPKRIALLVGIANTPSAPKFQALRAPVKDVRELKVILADRELGGYDEVEDLYNVTRDEVLKSLSKHLRNLNQDDGFLFYYSGHGDRIGLQQFNLVTTDYDGSKWTGLPFDTVKSDIRKCDARQKIAVLDCCFSGSALDPYQKKAKSDELSLEEALHAEGIYTLTASKKHEAAKEDPETGLSYLTEYILEGIKTGGADYSRTGVISADDIYRYVSANIGKKAKPGSNVQEPGRVGVGYGDFFFSRRRRSIEELRQETFDAIDAMFRGKDNICDAWLIICEFLWQPRFANVRAVAPFHALLDDVRVGRVAMVNFFDEAETRLASVLENDDKAKGIILAIFNHTRVYAEVNATDDADQQESSTPAASAPQPSKKTPAEPHSVAVPSSGQETPASPSKPFMPFSPYGPPKEGHLRFDQFFDRLTRSENHELNRLSRSSLAATTERPSPFMLPPRYRAVGEHLPPVELLPLDDPKPATPILPPTPHVPPKPNVTPAQKKPRRRGEDFWNAVETEGAEINLRAALMKQQGEIAGGTVLAASFMLAGISKKVQAIIGASKWKWILPWIVATVALAAFLIIQAKFGVRS